MNILFVLCEGQHDAQFLYRLLKASGQYSDPQWKIEDYPKPLPEFFKQNFQRQNLETIVIGKPTPLMVPIVAMKRNEAEDLVLIYTTGGETQVEYTLELLKKFFVFIPEENGDLSHYHGQGGGNKFALLFFYDADAAGRQGTLNTFVNRYGDFFEGLEGFDTDEWQRKRGIPLGLFIFTGEDVATGTLEDTLSNLFFQANENLVISARGLIDDHSNHQQGTIAQIAKREKSVLTVCGQAEKSRAGASLAVIVRHSELLNNVFDFTVPENQWARILTMIDQAFVEVAQ